MVHDDWHTAKSETFVASCFGVMGPTNEPDQTLVQRNISIPLNKLSFMSDNLMAQ